MSEAEAYAIAVALRDREALRDAFAMAALTGMFTAEWSKSGDLDAMAMKAFDAADAMIAAREPDPLRRDRKGVTPGMRAYLDKQKTRHGHRTPTTPPDGEGR